jgi:hypothetical protein
MAIPSRGIGWGTEENLLWQISKQLEYLSGITYNSGGGGSGSGTNGTSGVSGTSGLTGTSGSAGTAGASGTSGSAGTAGISGSSGSSGVAGTSGLSGDRYRTESVTEFTIGTGGTITVGTGLAYTTAQDIIIAYDSANHQVSMITSYDSGTGILVFGTPSEVEGTGTFSDWTVNLNGAAGGNGTAGTSGSAGTSGESGTSGVAGTSGSAGTSGATGTNGSSGTSASSGTAGIAGTAGTSGTSYSPPLPVVYGLYAQTANSTIVTNTTAETTIIGTGVGSLIVPDNGFLVGDSFRGILAGVINAGNNQTIRVKIKTGSVILADSGTQNLGSAITDDVWSLNIDFTIRQLGAAGVASIVTLGAFHYTKTNNASVQGFGFNTVNSTTFDTTVSNTLNVTVEWGSASTNNNIYSDVFVLNKIY